MAREVPHWMKEAQEHDPEFFPLVNEVLNKAAGRGVLDSKTKTLIMLALDAAGGHRDGVKSLAARARSLGAKEEEIKEVLRLAFAVAGLPGLISGLSAYEK